MLAQWLDTWSAFYSNHAMMRTAVEFVHIGGLVLGGGCAITADLATISAARRNVAARDAQLAVLERTHTLVIGGLIALSVSGALLFAADVDTFLHSRVFWLKMALLAVLIANGGLLVQSEQAARRGGPRAWKRLHAAAVSSLVLWFVTTLIGASLPNLG